MDTLPRWTFPPDSRINGTPSSFWAEDTGTDTSEAQMIAGIILAIIVLLNCLQKVQNENGTSLLIALAVFVTLLCLSPLFILILILLRIYRFLCDFYLRLTAGDSYVGLLEGPDAFWTTNETISNCAINVLAFVDFSQKDCSECVQIMRDTIKQRLLENLAEKYKKVLYKRQSQLFGFTYWTKHETIQFEHHVRLIQTNTISKTIEEPELKAVISKLCNSNLPQDNMTNWEVLLIDKKIEMKGQLLCPVLFRVHHSVADGYGLVDLFLNVLTDTERQKKDETSDESKNNEDKNGNKIASVIETDKLNRDCEESSKKRTKPILFAPSMAKFNWIVLKLKTKHLLQKNITNKTDKLGPLNSVKVLGERRKIASDCESKNNDSEKERYSKKSALKLDLREDKIGSTGHGTIYLNDTYYTPLSPMNSSIILDCFSCNKNQLNSLNLIGDYQKIVKSILNRIFNSYLGRLFKIFKNLLKIVFKIIFLPINIINKRIDDNILHNTSKSLSENKSITYIFDDNLFAIIKHIKTVKNIKFNEILFRSISDSLEEYFKSTVEAVNIITPVPMSTNRNKLENDFAVCMFDLPISHSNKTNIIHNNYINLTCNYELALNYFIIKHLIYCLPNFILKYAVQSCHSTLVLSNMVGPNQKINFSGYNIEGLIFFIPNKDTTGVGVTFLGYNNQLAMGLIMDDSLSDVVKEDADKILNNIKKSIYDMYAECCT
ncbi:hypothetical protein WDU94_002763 [Cyamophila willieti]